MVASPTKKGLHGGGFGSHPRNEARGFSESVGSFLRPEVRVPCFAELQQKEPTKSFEPNTQQNALEGHTARTTKTLSSKPWARIEQALRTTDLLLQGGGFGAIVFDMGSIAPEHASRVPLATWFRYRAAAEQTQAIILLLTQHSCAKSSVELLLRLQPGSTYCSGTTVLTGIEHRIGVVRQRFVRATPSVISQRKPPQHAAAAVWQSRSPWAGPR